MSNTVLDSVALAYQPVWDRNRQLAAVRLGVLAVHPEAVDGAHLLGVLGEDWPASAPLLSISFSSISLLEQALSSDPVHHTWIEVPSEQFNRPNALARLTAATRKGHKLLRQAPLAEVREEIIAPLEVRSLMWTSAEEALEALRNRGAVKPGTGNAPSPFLPGHLYQGIGCRALADHCLDEVGAWGVAGWPEDDVLYGWRDRDLMGATSVIKQCCEGISRDISLSQLERLVRQDPVLIYRVLSLVNSAAYGASREIETLRHAIMMLGFASLRDWLLQQLPHGESDTALHPVRFAQVMRARQAQHLLEPWAAEELRSEVYLSAIFSQLDRMLHQPLGPLLNKLPLPMRVMGAAVRQEGAYHRLLDVARAQGDFEHLGQLPAICAEHEMSLEQANRSLLRMLATTRDQRHPPRDHPWSMARN